MSTRGRVVRICVAWVALAGGSAQAAPPANGPLPAQALVLPAEFGMLLGIDARAIFTSAEYKGLLAGELLGTPLDDAKKTEVREGIAKALKEIESSTGVNPERDLDRLVFAMGGFEDKEPTLALVLIGRFDAARIKQALHAAATGGKTLAEKTVRGRTLYVVSKGGKPDSALVLLDATTLAFGMLPPVEAALANHAAGRRALEQDAGVLGLVKGLDPAASVWLALGPTATSAMRKKSGPNPPPVPIPDSVTMAGSFGGAFEIAAEMADEAAARNTADMVRGGLGALRMKIAQDPEAAKMPALKSSLDALEVAAEGKRVRLALPAPGGGAAAVGVIAAVAIPSLLRARVSANEAMAIGDLRTVISAEAAYDSVAQGYGDMGCLAEPTACMEDYPATGPTFIDSALAGASEKGGYKRAFHPGPAAKKPRLFQGFAYTATPLEQGRTGVRSFCGDASGRVCFDLTGAPIVPVDGACPATCSDLK